MIGLQTFIWMTIILLILTILEWSKIKNRKKEKMVFIILMGAAWILTFLLFLYPEMPGPTDLVNALYMPVGKFFED